MRDEMSLRFRKSGREIKAAASRLLQELRSRLERRNTALDEFLNDRNLVRSYLIRVSKAGYSHGGVVWPGDVISSERMEEIRQLSERIYEIEADVKRLELVVQHLADDQTFDLSYSELVSFGFNV
jgi:DNA repair exonuclease SbcCD ATPase subunit